MASKAGAKVARGRAGTAQSGASGERKAGTGMPAAKKQAGTRARAAAATKTSRSPKAAPSHPRVQPPSPRLADRRRKFVEAAERLFLERGFAGASVNEVVRIAGGSLATLYAEFGTKEELFEAVLTRRAGALFEGNWQDPSTIADVGAELRALATRMQARILSPDGLAIYRLAVAEAPRFPSLRQAFINIGLRGFMGHLSAYFAQLAQARRIRIDDPLVAAERFTSLLQGQHLFVAACGGAARISAAQRKQQVERVVEAFLTLYPLTSGRKPSSAR
jgi:AcrR family transcriptional regulator